MTVAPHGASWEQWAQWVSAMSVSQYLGVRCTEVNKGRVKLVPDGSSTRRNTSDLNFHQ